MNNTYGNNNQIEYWIRCMVNDELKQRDSDFVRRKGYSRWRHGGGYEFH